MLCLNTQVLTSPLPPLPQIQRRRPGGELCLKCPAYVRPRPHVANRAAAGKNRGYCPQTTMELAFVQQVIFTPRYISPHRRCHIWCRSHKSSFSLENTRAVVFVRFPRRWHFQNSLCKVGTGYSSFGSLPRLQNTIVDAVRNSIP